jgi:hypothetical protein
LAVGKIIDGVYIASADASWSSTCHHKKLVYKTPNLSFQHLSIADFTGMKIDASDLGVNAADA